MRFRAWAQKWLPDWAWDYYCWKRNLVRAQERYPRFRDYHTYRCEIRRVMWGDE